MTDHRKEADKIRDLMTTREFRQRADLLQEVRGKAASLRVGAEEQVVMQGVPGGDFAWAKAVLLEEGFTVEDVAEVTAARGSRRHLRVTW
jgi:hypothetical protein